MSTERCPESWYDGTQCVHPAGHGDWHEAGDPLDRGWRIDRDSTAYRPGPTDLEKRAAQAEAAVQRVRDLHTPCDTPEDPYADRRCGGCVAGYDPRTGELVHCAYPCETIRALEGTDGTGDGNA